MQNLQTMFPDKQGVCLMGWDRQADEHDVWMARVNAAARWGVMHTKHCSKPVWDLMWWSGVKLFATLRRCIVQLCSKDWMRYQRSRLLADEQSAYVQSALSWTCI